jgi:hypothetical protein
MESLYAGQYLYGQRDVPPGAGMRKWRNQDGGVALRSTMALATLLLIGGAIYLILTTNQQNQQTFHRKAQSISEYGLMLALQQLQQQPSWREGLPRTSYDGGWYSVGMKEGNTDGNRLTLTAEGGMGSATVQKVCVLNLSISPRGDSSWVRESIR